jgi:magnesium and cobalt transporter
VLVVNPVVRLLSPAQPASETVSTEELRLLVEHSALQGHIGTTENEMLQAVVGMADVSVREVMTPRVDIESVAASDSPQRLIEAARSTRKRVLPVRGHDLDDIRGIVYARELLLFPKVALPALMRPADFIPEQANLAQVIRHFREEAGHMAIVVDEYGGTAGLVTNEDVVEWIVGELPTSDVHRPPAAAEQIDENTYRVSGDLGIASWADRFGVAEVERRVDTVGGLILAKLGRLPRVGDRVRIRNLTLTVESMDRRRIETVLLHRDGRSAAESKS